MSTARLETFADGVFAIAATLLILNVDLDPAPFTDWITACGIEDARFTTIARELGRPVPVADVRRHAVAALEEVFALELEELPSGDGAGLWPQPVHTQTAGAR